MFGYSSARRRQIFSIRRTSSVPCYLPEENSAALHDLIGLRNRLVHDYGNIIDKCLHESIRDGLDDFKGFTAAIKTYMQNTPQSNRRLSHHGRDERERT